MEYWHFAYLYRVVKSTYLGENWLLLCRVLCWVLCWLLSGATDTVNIWISTLPVNTFLGTTQFKVYNESLQDDCLTRIYAKQFSNPFQTRPYFNQIQRPIIGLTSTGWLSQWCPLQDARKSMSKKLKTRNFNE